MKKFGWSLGFAAALALLAGQAQAQNAPSGNSYGTGSTSGSPSTTRDTTTGSSGTSSDKSTGTTGSSGTSGSMGTGAGAMGAGGAAAGATASNATGDFNALQGKVQTFDRSNNTLTLSGAPQPLKLDSSTKVTKDGSRASIDDIKEGDQVRASLSGSGDTLQVKNLDVTSSGAMGGTGTGSSGTTSPPSTKSKKQQGDSSGSATGGSASDSSATQQQSDSTSNSTTR